VKPKRLWLGGLILLLALSAGAVAFLLLHRGTQPDAEGKVSPAVVALGPSVLLPGKIESVEAITIPAPLDGKIESLLVGAGESVHEGQLLAQVRNTALEEMKGAELVEVNRLRARLSTLESRSIEANMQAAKAREAAGDVRDQLNALRKELERQQMLLRQGAAAKLKVEQLQNEVEAAATRHGGLDKVAQVAVARASEISKELDSVQQSLMDRSREYDGTAAQVASGEVTSPVDGFVVARRGQVGDEITVDVENFFEIAVDMISLQVLLQPPPPALERIKVGQEVVVQMPELADGILGVVSEVKGGNVLVKFTNPKPEVVKPGMDVQVFIKLS
jgi:multidrug efflux pump subunit AcrA (membrane-fusion protein)